MAQACNLNEDEQETKFNDEIAEFDKLCEYDYQDKNICKGVSDDLEVDMVIKFFYTYISSFLTIMSLRVWSNKTMV